jgi:hypothetical protein
MGFGGIVGHANAEQSNRVDGFWHLETRVVSEFGSFDLTSYYYNFSQFDKIDSNDRPQ